jgi:toxin ParE1/3/4
LNGLELQFLNEFENAINLIKQFPEAWLKVGNNSRRALLKRFPYFVLYVYENDCIYITCIAHMHRDPEYYIKRIK